MSIRTHSACLGAALAASFAAPGVFAQEGPNTGNLSVAAGGDFTTAYFFRGLLQEDDGFIFQPYGEIAFEVPIDDEFTLSTVVGIWNSFHTESTGTTGTNENWYEADIYLGAGLAFDRYEASVTYIWYTFPNGAFATVEEIDLGFAFDDSGLWDDLVYEGFALAPYLVIAFELDNFVTGDDEGIYGELGVTAFSYTFLEDGDYPIALEVPVTLGFSISDYYQDADGTGDDDFFGFLSVKAAASTPLAFIAPEYGAWSVGAGIELLTLGDTASDLNDNDESFEVIGSLGFAVEY